MNIWELMHILQFSSYKYNEISDRLVGQCAKFFSNHYGKWNGEEKENKKENERIRLSPSKLKSEYLSNETAKLYTATLTNKLVGYCCVQHLDIPGRGRVDWITQLVVSKFHRGFGIANRLIRSFISTEKDEEKELLKACGLVTSHPYAIRALESATKRRCNLQTTQEWSADLIEHSQLAYVSGCELKEPSMIDTDFAVDHTEIDELIEKIKPSWPFGSLPRKHEFFAFVFFEDPPYEQRSVTLKLSMEDMEKYETIDEAFHQLGVFEQLKKSGLNQADHVAGQAVVEKIKSMIVQGQSHDVTTIVDGIYPSFKLEVDIIF